MLRSYARSPQPLPGAGGSPGPTWTLPRTYFHLATGTLAPTSGSGRSSELPGAPFPSPEPGGEGQGGALSRKPTAKQLVAAATPPLPAGGQWYQPSHNLPESNQGHPGQPGAGTPGPGAPGAQRNSEGEEPGSQRGWEDEGTTPKPQVRGTYLGGARRRGPAPGKGRRKEPLGTAVWAPPPGGGTSGSRGVTKGPGADLAPEGAAPPSQVHVVAGLGVT